MIVAPDITNAELDQVYSDDYIRRAISHDGRQASAITHAVAEYLAARVGNIFCGAFLLVRSSNIEMDIHALLFKAAVRWSRWLGMQAIDHVFLSYPVERITACVFADLPTVGNYCIKLGFSYEGTRRNACKRGGVLTGVDMFGITRADWETQTWDL